MSAAEDDAKVTEAVLAVLAGPWIKACDFELENIKVQPKLYADVADAIKAKKITIITGDLPIGQGHYVNALQLSAENTAYDVLLLPRAGLGNSEAEKFTQKGLIVHECTHAAFDMRSTKQTHRVGEMLAYVAQYKFLIHGLLTMAKDPSKIQHSNPVNRAAWAIAWALSKGLKVTAQMITDFTAAISADAHYKDKVDKAVSNDGVGKAWKLKAR